jgi:hypothetical protein
MEYETSEVGKTYLRLTKIAFPNLPLTFEIGLLPTMTGCWYTDPCEKYDFVNWDYYDYYSQNKWTNKNHLRTTNQLWYIHLVGGFIPSQKYYSVGMIISNIWKKQMFQTTNQSTSYGYIYILNIYIQYYIYYHIYTINNIYIIIYIYVPMIY